MKAAIALFICVPALVWTSVSAEQLALKIYTTADGLAHNHINRIAFGPWEQEE